MVKPRVNRVPVMMSEEELKAIDDWRFKNRVATRSDAIRRLCKIANGLDEVIPEASEHAEWLLHEARQLFLFALESKSKVTRGEAVDIEYLYGYSEHMLYRSEAIFMILMRENNRIIPLFDDAKLSSAFQRSNLNEDKITRIIDGYINDEENYSDVTAIKKIYEEMSDEDKKEYYSQTPNQRITFWLTKLADYRGGLPAYSSDDDE